MGAVYRARDPRFDRDVAIKVLHEQFQRDPGVVERFKSEAVIQAKLNHPHIVSVLDFVADERHLAIVMEHVDGVSLDELIAQCAQPMEVQRAARLMEQLLVAMGYAHKRGLVHRDIKPSNVLVHCLDGQEYAKVTDFGIAKILGSEKLRTATGAKMGTLAYMSPEHVRSPKAVDARSDVYSLGVVLYELLTGRIPFEADSEYELMRQIVEDPVSAWSRPAGEVPGGLRGVVLRAMSKQASDRYATCEEMSRALREAVQGRAAVAAAAVPVAGEGPGQPKPVVPSPRASIRDSALDPVPAVASGGRSKTPWVVVAGVVLAAMAVVGVMESRRSQAEAERRQAEMDRRRIEEQAATERREAERRERAAAREAEERSRRQAAEYEAALARQAARPPGRWPETAERRISSADLGGLTKTELRLMRNEIYARHGRAFRSEDLRAHFSAQPWYRSSGRESVQLSPVELANVDTILRAEKRQP